MPSASQLIGTPAQLARRFAVATALGLFMGLIGPFGSYDVHPLERVASWLLSFWAGVLLFAPLLRTAEDWSVRTQTPRLFARTVAVALGCVPLAAISAASFHFVGGVPERRMTWLVWYAQVLAISLPAALTYLFVSSLGLAPTPADAPSHLSPAAPGREDLLSRLPARLGREVIALQMEDHYVRVHTALGSDLLLTPMAQAVGALSGVEGLRVHRSWWVARAAVQGSAWRGRNLRLRLKGGLEAPVARAQVAEVRAAGWLGEE